MHYALCTMLRFLFHSDNEETHAASKSSHTHDEICILFDYDKHSQLIKYDLSLKSHKGQLCEAPGMCIFWVLERFHFISFHFIKNSSYQLELYELSTAAKGVNKI